MPNWCLTNYVIEGDEKDIAAVKSIFDKTLARKTPVADNAYGQGWLGNLLDTFGEPWKAYPCRGNFSEARLDEQGHFHFVTETAWSRCDCVEQVIKKYFPKVNIYFREEELGNGIFQTNDEQGEFFPEQYIIDSSNDGVKFYTQAKAIETISQLAGKPIGTLKEAKAWTNQHNATVDELKGDNYVYIHRAEIVEM
jgi:hypothetical protein